MLSLFASFHTLSANKLLIFNKINIHFPLSYTKSALQRQNLYLYRKSHISGSSLRIMQDRANALSNALS